MKLILLNIASSLKENIIPLLYTKGVEVYAEDSPQKALQIMKNKNIYLALIDDDFKEPNWNKILEDTKNKGEDIPLRILLFTKSTDKDFISRYIKHGLASVISKKLDPVELVQSLIANMDKFAKEGDERKVVRINPPEDQSIYIGFPIMDAGQSRQIKGKIKDISPTGAAFEFMEPSDSYHLSEGQHMDTIDIYIHKRTLFTPCKIVKLKSPAGVVVFDKPKESFVKGIGNYLFDYFNQQ